MDYRLPHDDIVRGTGHMQMPNVMEVVPTSDDDTPGSPSTPGSNRRYVPDGRAMSSPNISNLGGESGSVSAADKKRNKLGYHRTAVACGHCRRRKIRCIPANDDTSGRCSNCIRLKKECQFFPVDQPNASAVRKGRANSSKADAFVGDGDVSASSSEPGNPHILRSSTADSVSRMNEARTPVSPEEPFNFHRFGYSTSHQNDSFDHSLEVVSPKETPPPNPSSFQQPDEFIPASGSQRVQGSRPSMYGAPMFNSIPANVHEQAFYQQQQQQLNGNVNEYAWNPQGQERSMPLSEAQGSYTNFAPPNRAHSFPAVPGRRASTPYDMSRNFSSGHGFAAGDNYQNHLQQYPDPVQYSNMGWNAQTDPRMSPFPGASTMGSSQPWYNPQLAHVREEEDTLASHGQIRHPFQPG